MIPPILQFQETKLAEELPVSSDVPKVHYQEKPSIVNFAAPTPAPSSNAVDRIAAASPIPVTQLPELSQIPPQGTPAENFRPFQSVEPQSTVVATVSSEPKGRPPIPHRIDGNGVPLPGIHGEKSSCPIT